METPTRNPKIIVLNCLDQDVTEALANEVAELLPTLIPMRLDEGIADALATLIPNGFNLQPDDIVPDTKGKTLAQMHKEFREWVVSQPYGLDLIIGYNKDFLHDHPPVEEFVYVYPDCDSDEFFQFLTTLVPVEDILMVVLLPAAFAIPAGLPHLTLSPIGAAESLVQYLTTAQETLQ